MYMKCVYPVPTSCYTLQTFEWYANMHTQNVQPHIDRRRFRTFSSDNDHNDDDDDDEEEEELVSIYAADMLCACVHVRRIRSAVSHFPSRFICSFFVPLIFAVGFSRNGLAIKKTDSNTQNGE